MAKDFVKLSEVTVLEEVADTASVLVEQNGEIYRAPKTQVGGAGGIKTAIIRDDSYLKALDRTAINPKIASVSYECLNMTFAEVYEAIIAGEPIVVLGMFSLYEPSIIPGSIEIIGPEELTLHFISWRNGYYVHLNWFPDGLYET